ncbi:MAG TPA: hypothetical protein VG652_04450 [Gaiellaceae bacterium]|nr:hypothetical protein [Gaiellaceae bacterium]
MPGGTEAAAASIGATDVFVLRRVTGQRFVHLGGSGRGEGWAGIVEVAIDDEKPLARAFETGKPVSLDHGSRDLVFGPYYARAAAIVPVLPDVVVVFGVGEGTISSDEDALQAAGEAAAAAVEPAGTAKRLADELEVLEAIRASVSVPSVSVDEAMQSLAEIAATALSCELGIVYLADGDRIAVAERGWPLGFPKAEIAAALAETLARAEFPFCVQDAHSSPPPGLLATDAGIRSYYLLELTGTARGVLFVAHTDAAPRGFTLLCRRLGLRVTEVASAVIGVALTREWTAAESARLQSAFATLER